ncbi:hypothetical protein [Pediococcus damnosus]|nr:hypothetical protein [Pediococcus damnosus]
MSIALSQKSASTSRSFLRLATFNKRPTKNRGSFVKLGYVQKLNAL